MSNAELSSASLSSIIYFPHIGTIYCAATILSSERFDKSNHYIALINYELNNSFALCSLLFILHS